VGGVAVAFALQQILGDIFCSVAIVLDKPFEVGDFIISGEHMGSVEHIGVKTTRVRSLGGEQIVFPNSDLIGSRVRNYKRMLERRVVFSFGVLYATKAETLEQIPGIVREIVEGLEQTRFDRAHFAKFGDSSLDFEVVYYVLSPDYNLFMDLQQQINLAIFRRMEEMGVGFAFPSRSLYVEGTTRPFRTEVLLRDGARPKGGDGA
jgi:small-conductance mechanosensitive channel